MASVGGLFSETLHSITTTKLDELSKKRVSFENQYDALKAAAGAEQDPLNRLFIVVDGVKSCFQIRTRPVTEETRPDGQPRLGSVINDDVTNVPGLINDLRLIDRFLEQAKFDPSISAAKLDEWERTMWRYLSMQSIKYEYADLYGRLVTEWLASEKKLDSQDTEMEDVDAFDEVPGGNKRESRKEWKRSVFEAAHIDEVALKKYLNELYGEGGGDETRDLQKALKTLRDKVSRFELALAQPALFTKASLHWTIKSLQGSDLLNDEKRAILKDFLSNDIILTEVADVLNMRLMALSNWTWGTEVPVEQRRMLSGSYSIYLREDLLQAIFLQYLGVRWSVFFKGALKEFRSAKGVWKPLRSVPKLDKRRREYYLGQQHVSESLNSKRLKLWKNNYFLFQLPNSETQMLEYDEGEEEAEITPAFPVQQPGQTSGRAKQTARKNTSGKYPIMRMQTSAARILAPGGPPEKRMRPSADDESEDDDYDEGSCEPKRPMEVKQNLLHLLATEIAINTRIYGEITAFRSAFDKWNPLLPHQTILAVLSFFGVSKKWLGFFQRFLEAPLRFTDETAEPRTRKRGTPGAHALSDMFGEVVMFILDFAVNQKTGGALLYRVFDDFWFWSRDVGRAVDAWKEIERFTKTIGAQLHGPKTGTVRISSNPSITLEIDSALPEGKIRWGFLYLNPQSGRFEIDQTMIDTHINELRSQLQSKDKSVFAWIRAWNTYATTFFTANFSNSANCFGREHVDAILSTHQYVHRSLFPDDGSVVAYLKRLLEQRFDVGKVPDGFLFFPIELGGLALTSPFVGPLQVRNNVLANPSERLDDFQDYEKVAYEGAKESFDRGTIHEERYLLDDPDWEPADGKDEFMPFSEYVKYREDFDYGFDWQLSVVFDNLLQKPVESPIDCSPSLMNAITALGSQQNLNGITNSWHNMEAYWKWVAQMYGPEMIEKFGGLNIVDPGLLPVGMVSLFRGRRVTWQG